MSELLAEVDEAMRQERLAKFWHENAALIIAFIVGTIVLTGAMSAYRAWDENTKQNQTTALIELIGANEYPENILGAEDLKFRSDLNAIAQLGAAGSFIRRNQPQDAAALYTKIAADASTKPQLRDLATIMSVRLSLAATNENTDAQALLDTLKTASSKKSIYAPLAQIEAATIHAHLLNDYATAQDILTDIINTQALPPTLVARAKSMRHIYAIKQKETQKEAASK